MNENKNLVIFIIIAAAAVIIVVIVGVIMLFTGNSKGSSTTNSGNPSTAVAVAPGVETVIPGVTKDSILKSEDSGLSFETYFRIDTSTELGDVDALDIIFHPEKEDKIIVSTYDNGLFLNEDKINHWQPIIFPPQKIYSYIVDKTDPDNKAFASGVVSGNGRIFRTSDGGGTWRVVYAEPGNNTYVSAITQDPVNSNVIVAGTSAGTFVRSVDGGDTWKNIGQTIAGSIKRFAHDSKGSSLTYILVSSGKIYHSYDSGITWLNWEEIKAEEIKELNAESSRLSRAGDKTGAQYAKDQAKAIQERNKTEKIPSGIINIIADPNKSGVLYATLSKGIYRSTDYGKYWKPINIIESAEKFPIPSLAINPVDSNEISFVAGNTFYRSVNYGVTWAITPLDKTRNASFVAYDPFDPTTIFIGLSAKK